MKPKRIKSRALYLGSPSPVLPTTYCYLVLTSFSCKWCFLISFAYKINRFWFPNKSCQQQPSRTSSPSSNAPTGGSGASSTTGNLGWSTPLSSESLGSPALNPRFWGEASRCPSFVWSWSQRCGLTLLKSSSYSGLTHVSRVTGKEIVLNSRSTKMLNIWKDLDPQNLDVSKLEWTWSLDATHITQPMTKDSCCVKS